ncbi:hypothetical protein ABU614_08755 [Lysobacter firmicutimachus]|uniref:Metalloprotease StcE beta-sandwich domain-containing protein n=1 Tax=Lysobacter firmicutimachus TaxID=1792846 RepID=A0AAU8N057_9GAMM
MVRQSAHRRVTADSWGRRKWLALAAVLLQVSSSAHALDSTPVSLGCSNSVCMLPAGMAGIDFSLSNGNWAPEIVLPDAAPDGSLITIGSSAVWGSSITNGAEAMPVGQGDLFAFVREEGGWTYVTDPESLDCKGSECALPSNLRRIKFLLSNGNWAQDIVLPAAAAEGASITIQSSAGWSSTISNGASDVAISQGDTFQFVRSGAAWVSPVSKVEQTLLQFGCTDGSASCSLPTMSSPVTKIAVGNSNWSSTVRLPATARPGDVVVIRNDASNSVGVVAGDATLETLATGSVGRYFRDGDGGWTSAYPVKVLLVYSSQAADAAGGASEEELRLARLLDFTNTALENSAANFYLVAAETIQYDLAATTLAAAYEEGIGQLKNGASDLALYRATYQADMVVYEGALGTSDGCGRAFTSPAYASDYMYPEWIQDSKESMLAVISLHAWCDDFVMPHEVGHLAGLLHEGTANTYPARIYAKGASNVGDLMGKRGAGVAVIPYFSNPRLYTSTGLRMGEPGLVDSVRAMNENAPTISNFYP